MTGNKTQAKGKGQRAKGERIEDLVFFAFRL